MKYFTAVRTAWAVFRAIRKRKKREQKALELEQAKYMYTFGHKHNAQVLYAKLLAIASGDPEPEGN